MAIQESDIMDFGNGIIGDDTFDVWRKKTNSLKGEIDLVNTTLTNKINTDVDAVMPLFVPIAGAATSVSTSLQLTSPLTLTDILDINGATLTSNSNKLVSNREFDSSIQLTSPKVKATSKLILGTKEYTVPSSPAINNAVLTSATTAGQLQWRNPAELFSDAGGLQQTTAVFEEVMPVGAVIACAEDPNDNNFLECNGGSVLKSDYTKLYEVLKGGGDTARYGETAGDSGTFTLPNYSGRVLVGTGTAGSYNFGNSFGADGGDTATSTNTHTLTAAQSGLPAHDHFTNFSNDMGVDGDGRGRGAAYSGDSRNASLPRESYVNVFTTNAGGTAADDADESHSHYITTENRIQPYVTVKYYIKAFENSKVDFKINVNNSGLKSTVGGSTPQTLISVSNETHTLSVNPDNTSIALDNNFKVSVKSSPTIEGTITATGNVISDEPTAANHLTTKNYVDTSGITQTTGSAPYFGVRAFAAFNASTGGSTTHFTSGKGNIDSVTRSAAGSYKFNFVIPMADTDYSVVVGGSFYGSTGNSWISAYRTTEKNTDYFVIAVQGGAPSGTSYDPGLIDVFVIG